MPFFRITGKLNGTFSEILEAKDEADACRIINQWGASIESTDVDFSIDSCTPVEPSDEKP